MNHKAGAEAPETGVYWCTVCKRPERFEKGQKFPACRNMCGRGYWQLVKQPPPAEKSA
jgi:hypothetical protein